MDKCCKNCLYWHRLKYGFEVWKGYKESSCCIAWTRLDEDIDEYDSFIVETNADDMCEMFTRKENAK